MEVAVAVVVMLLMEVKVVLVVVEEVVITAAHRDKMLQQTPVLVAVVEDNITQVLV